MPVGMSLVGSGLVKSCCVRLRLGSPVLRRAERSVEYDGSSLVLSWSASHVGKCRVGTWRVGHVGHRSVMAVVPDLVSVSLVQPCCGSRASRVKPNGLWHTPFGRVPSCSASRAVAFRSWQAQSRMKIKRQLKLESKSLSEEQLQIVASELNAIERRDGMIVPKRVVESARDDDSPLHNYFEWNNSKAAEGYREWQARMLIRQVFVRDLNQGEEGPSVRAFVNIKAIASEDDEEDTTIRGYVSMQTCLKNSSMQEQVLLYAKTELLRWKNKFGNLKEFLQVTEVIEKTVK